MNIQSKIFSLLSILLIVLIGSCCPECNDNYTVKDITGESYVKGHIILSPDSVHSNGIIRISTGNVREHGHKSIACVFDWNLRKSNLFNGQNVYVKVISVNSITMVTDLKFEDEIADLNIIDPSKVNSNSEMYGIELHNLVGIHQFNDGTYHGGWHPPFGEITRTSRKIKGRNYIGIKLKSGNSEDTIYFEASKVPTDSLLNSGVYINTQQMVEESDTLRLATNYSDKHYKLHFWDIFKF